MAFDEVQFPDDVSYGSTGGPGFKTNIIVQDSGQEQRIARRSKTLHRYDAGYGVKTYDQLYNVKAFYVARLGCANGFRFKDWLDYTTAANGRDNPAFDDQVLVSTASANVFRIVKRYMSGIVTRVRELTKPVTGTLTIGADGSLVDPSQYTVDYATGLVTFPGGAPGATVTVGCEFDVPVRFGASIDEVFDQKLEGFEDGSCQIPLQEIASEDQSNDDFNFGGAIEYDGTTPVSLNVATARVVVVVGQPTDVFLPDNSNLPAGGPYFVIFNEGGEDVVIKVFGGGSSIGSVAGGTAGTVYLSVDAVGAKTWYVC